LTSCLFLPSVEAPLLVNLCWLLLASTSANKNRLRDRHVTKILKSHKNVRIIQECNVHRVIIYHLMIAIRSWFKVYDSTFCSLNKANNHNTRLFNGII
jgi:hypothetical protein